MKSRKRLRGHRGILEDGAMDGPVLHRRKPDAVPLSYEKYQAMLSALRIFGNPDNWDRDDFGELVVFCGPATPANLVQSALEGH